MSGELIKRIEPDNHVSSVLVIDTRRDTMRKRMSRQTSDEWEKTNQWIFVDAEQCQT